VFIPLFNTVWRRDLDENILVSIERGQGIKVLMGFTGETKNILGIFWSKPQGAPGGNSFP